MTLLYYEGRQWKLRERERERERERLPMGRDFVGDLDGQSHKFPVAWF